MVFLSPGLSRAVWDSKTVDEFCTMAHPFCDELKSSPEIIRQVARQASSRKFFDLVIFVFMMWNEICEGDAKLQQECEYAAGLDSYNLRGMLLNAEWLHYPKCIAALETALQSQIHNFPLYEFLFVCFPFIKFRQSFLNGVLRSIQLLPENIAIVEFLIVKCGAKPIHDYYLIGGGGDGDLSSSSAVLHRFDLLDVALQQQRSVINGGGWQDGISSFTMNFQYVNLLARICPECCKHNYQLTINLVRRNNINNGFILQPLAAKELVVLNGMNVSNKQLVPYIDMVDTIKLAIERNAISSLMFLLKIHTVSLSNDELHSLGMALFEYMSFHGFLFCVCTVQLVCDYCRINFSPDTAGVVDRLSQSMPSSITRGMRRLLSFSYFNTLEEEEEEKTQQQQQQSELEKYLIQNDLERFRSLLRPELIQHEKISIDEWHELVFQCSSLNRLEMLIAVLEFLAVFRRTDQITIFQDDHNAWFLLLTKIATHEARQIIFAYHPYLLFSENYNTIRKRTCEEDECKKLGMDVELNDAALEKLYVLLFGSQRYMAEFSKFCFGNSDGNGNSCGQSPLDPKENAALRLFLQETKTLFGLRKQWIRTSVPFF